MSEVKVVRRWPRYAPSTEPTLRDIARPAGSFEVVAIGASTGGPAALQTILAGLPQDFPCPVLIVQHMTPGFVHGFVDWLRDASRFRIRVATDGELLLAGHAYVAPDDFHMGVRPGHRIHLTRDSRHGGLCPSVSHLFGSVEQVYGRNAVGILLTGMGRDGVDELKRLKNAGAVTIAQDANSSIVHGMPGEAIQIGAAKYVLPPHAIARTLTTMTARLPIS
jgi:two-component system chemotaxis response regulator CheB